MLVLHSRLYRYRSETEHTRCDMKPSCLQLPLPITLKQSGTQSIHLFAAPNLPIEVLHRIYCYKFHIRQQEERFTMGFASIFKLLGVANGMVDSSFVDPVIVYRVRIRRLSTIIPSPASTGLVTIFTDTSSMLVAYAGIVSNLEPNLLASTCNATNGCGVHIHSGRSCNSTSTQGGHYYDNVTVPIDPWIDERYSSDTRGKANFQSVLKIGSVDIEGRVFVGTYFDSFHV